MKLRVLNAEGSKKFEEFRRGTAQSLAAEFHDRRTKVEIVIIISGTRIPGWMRLPEPANAQA